LKRRSRHIQRSLGEIISCLRFDLLRAVCERHPELQPAPDEPSHIISELRWEDVALPESVSATDLDSIIFSVLKTREQKTAMVVKKGFTPLHGT
jgi:hypothetical protein